MSDRHDTLLYLDGVSVSFDGFKAINDLSFVLVEGEMRAIIGPNGAGKTTMMDIITGKTRPDEGEVYFKGKIDLTAHDEADIATMGIGRKFQKPTVFESHTVEDNIALALAGDRRVFPTLFRTRTLVREGRIVALRTAEAFKVRHLHMIAAATVMRRVAAMTNVCARRTEERLCMFDPLSRFRDRFGFRVIVLGQSLNLFNVENRVSFHERNGALFLAAVFLLLGLGDFVGIDHLIAAFALLHIRAEFLGLLEGHPVGRQIARFHRRAPKHQDIDSAIGHAVVTQRFDNPPVHVSR